MKRLKNFLMQVSSKYFLVWIFATSFFLLGHFLYLGWDFSVYVLNSQFLFSDGHYFEISRAPLISLLLGMLHFFGWKAAEYFYIVFISFLFFYSSLRFARSTKINPFFFYLFSVNAFVLLFGFVEGTELLSLALLELFLVFLFEDKGSAGVFLGLACLTRYPLVIFFPLLLFHCSWKKRLTSTLSFILPFLPWFLYNSISYGNIFYSIADSYALNVFYRDYVPHTITLSSLLFVANLLLPLILLGLYALFTKKMFSRMHLILGTSMLLMFYSLFSMKADVLRYYIFFTIPFAFLAVTGFELFSSQRKKIILICFVLFTCALTLYGFIQYEKESYSALLPHLQSIDDCALQSNIWVPLNYYGRVSEPFPTEDMLSSVIQDGFYVLFFFDAREPAYMINTSLLHSYPIVFETQDFILLGNGCLSITPVERSYLERLNLRLLHIYNYTVSDDPCQILFHERIFCSFVNTIFTVP